VYWFKIKMWRKQNDCGCEVYRLLKMGYTGGWELDATRPKWLARDAIQKQYGKLSTRSNPGTFYITWAVRLGQN
jgi:hypothetical protein